MNFGLSTSIQFELLKVFGTKCYAHISKNFRQKLDKSVFGHILRYVNKKIGYKINFPSQNEIKSRDMYFKSERLCTVPATVQEDLRKVKKFRIKRKT